MTGKTMLHAGDPYPALAVDLAQFRSACSDHPVPGPRPLGWPGPPGVTASQRRRCASPPKPSSAHRGCPMAPLPHDQDITSWLQLLSAIEEAEAGRGTARLTEIVKGHQELPGDGHEICPLVAIRSAR